LIKASLFMLPYIVRLDGPFGGSAVPNAPAITNSFANPRGRNG
jgi:hypothetical protein